MRTVNRIIIHCSDSDTVADAASIKAFHTAPPPRGRGWKDIGYHYVITKDGNIEYGRPETEIGAHCQGFNKESIGICLGGKAKFTQQQLEAMRFLVREILHKYKLNFLHVYCHYELDNHGKTCPNLPAELVRAFVKPEK